MYEQIPQANLVNLGSGGESILNLTSMICSDVWCVQAIYLVQGRLLSKLDKNREAYFPYVYLHVLEGESSYFEWSWSFHDKNHIEKLASSVWIWCSILWWFGGDFDLFPWEFFVKLLTHEEFYQLIVKIRIKTRHGGDAKNSPGTHSVTKDKLPICSKIS